MFGILLVFSGPTVGCSITMKAYTGPDLPDDRVATITTRGFHFYVVGGSNVNLVAVDGQRELFATKAKVLPGRHTIDIQYAKGGGYVGSQTQATLTLDAEAGRVYEISATFTHVWAIDKSTGEVVAGLKPED